LDFLIAVLRGLRTNWLIVGINTPFKRFYLIYLDKTSDLQIELSMSALCRTCRH